MPDAALLLLPGMALNATIFPAFAVPTTAPDFSSGPGAPGAGFAAYRAALDRLTDTDAWRTASRRIVVGHSFGGMLALSWLLADGGTGRPLINGLVLIATTAGPMYDAATVRFGPLRIPTRPLMALWNHPVVTAGAKLLLGAGRTSDVDFQRYRRRSEIAVGLAGWRLTSVAGRRAYRAAMTGFDVRDRLGQMRVPTIVLHGTRDTYFRTPVAEALARGLPEAELRLVRGARHVLPITHPEPVERAVADLIGSA